MKKVLLLSAMIGICFSASSLSADSNHAQSIVASQDRTHSASFFGAKPKPVKWLTGEEHISFVGPKPRPPEWFLKEQAARIIGSKPKPPEW